MNHLSVVRSPPSRLALIRPRPLACRLRPRAAVPPPRSLHGEERVPSSGADNRHEERVAAALKAAEALARAAVQTAAAAQNVQSKEMLTALRELCSELKQGKEQQEQLLSELEHDREAQHDQLISQLEEGKDEQQELLSEMFSELFSELKKGRKQQQQLFSELNSELKKGREEDDEVAATNPINRRSERVYRADVIESTTSFVTEVSCT